MDPVNFFLYPTGDNSSDYLATNGMSDRPSIPDLQTLNLIPEKKEEISKERYSMTKPENSKTPFLPSSFHSGKLNGIREKIPLHQFSRTIGHGSQVSSYVWNWCIKE